MGWSEGCLCNTELIGTAIRIHPQDVSGEDIVARSTSRVATRLVCHVHLTPTIDVISPELCRDASNYVCLASLPGEWPNLMLSMEICSQSGYQVPRVLGKL